MILLKGYERKTYIHKNSLQMNWIYVSELIVIMNYGYTRIPIDSLIKLAKLYNVDMNYITGVSKILNCYPKE